MIRLAEHAQGLLLPVRAHAGARKNELKGIQNGELKVAVTQAPEKGKANQAIVEVLAKSLGLRKSQLELVAGPTSPHKTFLVREVTAAELLASIERALG